MKIFKTIIIFIAILVLAWLIVSGQHTKDRDTLYQVSVLSALMKGDYDGKMTLDEIRRHGDFGIGTFDRLDGELVELDGIFYQVRFDGLVRRLSGRIKSPFSMTTFFGADMEFSITGNPDYVYLRRSIDAHLPTKNIPYAIRIDGKFDSVKVRSVSAQKKPYPSLAEATRGQGVFEFNNIEGTLVGFSIPDYMRGVNMPGYHLHFISRDRTKGGHLLACMVNNAKAGIDNIDNFIMTLPDSQDFYRLDLSGSFEEAYAAE